MPPIPRAGRSSDADSSVSVALSKLRHLLFARFRARRNFVSVTANAANRPAAAICIHELVAPRRNRLMSAIASGHRGAAPWQ